MIWVIGLGLALVVYVIAVKSSEHPDEDDYLYPVDEKEKDEK